MLLDTTWRVRDADNVVLIDLNADGYSVVQSSEDDETWDRLVSSSPWADGDAEVIATKQASVRTITVQIKCDSWAEVETRRLALKAATTEREWFLEQDTEGVSQLWRAGRADSSSSFSSMDLFNRRRFVVLRIPVQPGPSVTGLGA